MRCCANNSSVIRSSPEALGATLAPALSAQRPMTKIRIASSYVRPRALPTNRCPARDDMLSSVGRVWRAKLHRAGRRFPASGRGLRASAVSTTNRHRSRAIPVRPRVGPRVAPAHSQASPNMISFCCERLLHHEWIGVDMRQLALGPRFDGILAGDSFFHVSQHDPECSRFSPPTLPSARY